MNLKPEIYWNMIICFSFCATLDQGIHYGKKLCSSEWNLNPYLDSEALFFKVFNLIGTLIMVGRFELSISCFSSSLIKSSSFSNFIKMDVFGILSLDSIVFLKIVIIFYNIKIGIPLIKVSTLTQMHF